MSVTLQIELPEKDAALLLDEANRHGISISELLQHLLRRNNGSPSTPLTEEQYTSDPLWTISGMAQTETADVSVNHDQYLYDEDH